MKVDLPSPATIARFARFNQTPKIQRIQNIKVLVEATGLSQRAVRYRIKRGMPDDVAGALKWCDEAVRLSKRQREQAFRMGVDGHNVRDVAKAVGRTTRGVHRWWLKGIVHAAKVEIGRAHV